VLGSRLKSLLDSTSGTVVVGGKTDEERNYISPTLVIDVSLTDSLMKDEVTVCEMLFILNHMTTTTTTITTLQSFYGPLDFVWDYPDEPVPEIQMTTQIHYVLEMMTINNTTEAFRNLWIISIE